LRRLPGRRICVPGRTNGLSELPSILCQEKRLMRALKAVAVLGLVAAVATTARAQSCMGKSSLDNAKMNFGASAWFPDGSTQFGGEFNMRHVGFGQNHFINLSVDHESTDGPPSSSANQFGAGLGIELKAANKIEWCPNIGFSYWKPDVDDVSSTNLSIGAGITRSFGNMGGLEMLPFGSLAWNRTTAKVADNSTSDNTWTYGGGLGFRLGSGIQFSPQIMKSSVDGSDAVFGVSLTIPIGK
jgi:hypothetical protein